MFCLQESELIEDNIKDSNVLKLYKILRQYEFTSDRQILKVILFDDSCVSLTQFILKYHKFQDLSIDEVKSEELKFSGDQREVILQALNLSRHDAASLALIISATLMQLFVIDNFTGPTNDEILRTAYDDLPDCYQSLKSLDHQSLSRDGSEVYHQVKNPWLLKLVQLYWLLLDSLSSSRRLLELEFLVWKHRYLTVHLMIMLEPAESLVNELRKIQEFIFDHHIINDQGTGTQLTRFNVIELCCELVQSSLLRDGITFCRKFYDFATDESGLAIEHTGVLGKRTKFQQTAIPQLVVKITKKKGIGEKIIGIESERADALPMNVMLEDDTLLPDISFVEKDEDERIITEEQASLEVSAQLLMLANLDIILKSEVMEESLKDEWTLAYLRSIINSASIWTVKCKALALRSMVEKKHMRKMDRALRQMEELIKESRLSDNGADRRMQSFYSVLCMSTWQLGRSLGDISMDLSLFKNALDVYARIEYWEGMIKCYCALGQTVKAEKIIRQELAKKETPYLYCLLGDVTENIEHYEISWNLSKCKFARAKKSIGTYYYVRKNYEKAIENYELALEVNPSNVSILSLLAYSCLTVERYERAAECYRNLTYHDDGSFLAWNNLSKAYIKLNQKERAWRTLREAIKCNYEEWKIWENFLVVSMEIGALEDVIMAWHRIIDIKSSHKDDQVLAAMTYALISKPYSKVDSKYIQLLNSARELVARLNATSDCSPKLWISYSKLLVKEHEVANLCATLKIESGPKLSKLDIDSRISKITNALQRATPTVITTDSDWLQIPEKIIQVLHDYDELLNCYRWALEVVGARPELWRQWKYFKLSISNVMKLLNNRGYKSSE